MRLHINDDCKKTKKNILFHIRVIFLLHLNMPSSAYYSSRVPLDSLMSVKKINNNKTQNISPLAHLSHSHILTPRCHATILSECKLHLPALYVSFSLYLPSLPLTFTRVQQLTQETAYIFHSTTCPQLQKCESRCFNTKGGKNCFRSSNSSPLK